MADLFEFCNSVGLPTGLILLMLWVCLKIGKFLKPMVSALFETLQRALQSHISLMDRLDKTLFDMSKNLEKMGERQDKQGVALSKILEHLYADGEIKEGHHKR